jgi:phosphoribosyl 1,2-cyclic phosphodiesterase
MIDIQVLASSSSGNCYYINDGQTPLLLDCGISFKDIQRRLNFQTSSIAGVLLSHEHGDHSKACKDVLKAGLDIYSQQDTFDALGLKSHRLRPVVAKEQFPIGTWSILPFELEHDCSNLGFLMQSNVTGEKLLYMTDTYYCRYNFSGLNYILIECNHSYEILRANVDSGALPVAMKNRLIKSHFSLENVKEFLKSNDLSHVQAIYLIHLSDGNSHAEQFKREIMAQTGKMVIVADK